MDDRRERYQDVPPLASRFRAAGFRGLVPLAGRGGGEVLSLLRSYASWLGLDQGALDGYEPRAGCQAHTAYVSWLARPRASSRDLGRGREEGRAAGESSARAQRAARLLQAYELLFWDTLAEGL